MTWSIDWTFGSTSQITGKPKFETPGTMTIDGDGGTFAQAGSAWALDSGTTYYNGVVTAWDAGDNVMSARVFLNNSETSTNVPFTWTTSDELHMSGTYMMDDVDAPTS